MRTHTHAHTHTHTHTHTILWSYINKYYKKNFLFKKVGIAVPKSIQTRVEMIEINPSTKVIPTFPHTMNFCGVTNKAVS